MLNTDNNQTLIVTRDGQLDKDYYNHVRFEQRTRHLKARSKEMAIVAAKTPIYALKASAWLFANALEQTNEYNKQYR